MTTDDESCLFCGEPEELSIQDIWVDGNFTLATCCGGFLEHVSAEMHADPVWAKQPKVSRATARGMAAEGRALLRRLGAEKLTGHMLRRVTDGMLNGPVLDYNLQVRDVSFPAARAFIDRHHRHCGAPHAWRYGAAIYNGYARMDVVTVGNPVAPAFNGRGIVEVNRLCVRDDLDPMLKWNACSTLYAHSAREAERRGFNRIITYVRADEDGGSLRAAGWLCDGPAGGGGWHSKRRPRSNRNSWIARQRWSRTLQPKLLAGPRLPRMPNAQDWLSRAQNGAALFGID